MQPSTLHDVYELLRALDRDRAGPEEALARVARARGSAELAELDLIWERAAHDGSLHFDALLPSPDGTLSMSWCPDRGVPWPLRGAQRNADADLVRVDGYTLQVHTAIALMDLVWDDDDILTRLIDAAILQKQQSLLGIELSELSDQQLQQAMNEFRQRRSLLTAEDTERWMEEHGLDLSRLESIVADNLVRSLVRDRLIVPTIDAWLADLTPFDKVAVEWLAIDDAAQAGALFERVREGQTTLAAEAARRFAAGGPAPATLAWLARRDLPDDVAARLFGTAPGALLPPFELGGVTRIARVLTSERADPTAPATAERVREACFASWLADHRRAVAIEWFWGFDEARA